MNLVYFSPVSWNDFEQRPHKFVKWYHEKYKADVLWVQPYPTRLPLMKDFYRLKEQRGLRQSVNASWLKTVTAPALPIEPLYGSSVINGFFWKKTYESVDAFIRNGECCIGVGKPSALAIRLLRKYSALFSFYDCMDNFPAFYQGVSRRSMERREKVLANLVNKIMVSSSSLRPKFDTHINDVSLVLNACDVDMLPEVEDLSRSESVILGYVGMMNDWFDWSLVVALAKTDPSVVIRLIGPVRTPYQGVLPRNVEVLPACDHASALKAMEDFSIGIIPFKVNELTASVDPIKYYEYRALGLPVLSTGFGEMAYRQKEEGVFLVDESSDLQASVRVASTYVLDSNDVKNFRCQNSWSGRFDSSDIFPGD